MKIKKKKKKKKKTNTTKHDFHTPPAPLKRGEKTTRKMDLDKLMKQVEKISKLSNFSTGYHGQYPGGMDGRIQSIMDMADKITTMAETISSEAYQISRKAESLCREATSSLPGTVSFHHSTGLANQISIRTKHHRQSTNEIRKITASQQQLFGQLQRLMNGIRYPAQPYNHLEVVINGITAKYESTFMSAPQWEETAVVEETHKTIQSMVEDISVNSELLTVDHIEKLKEELLKQLTPVLTKTQSRKVKDYILELITIISFILTIYSYSSKELSEEELRQIIKEELRNTHSLGLTYKSILTERITIRETPLKHAPRKKAQTTGIVKKGQSVIVVETRHKYLYITYIDKDTNEPKAGYVLKKYFKNIP